MTRESTLSSGLEADAIARYLPLSDVRLGLSYRTDRLVLSATRDFLNSRHEEFQFMRTKRFMDSVGAPLALAVHGIWLRVDSECLRHSTRIWPRTL